MPITKQDSHAFDEGVLLGVGQRHVVIGRLVLPEKAGALRHVIREQAGGHYAGRRHVINEPLRPSPLISLQTPIRRHRHQ